MARYFKAKKSDRRYILFSNGRRRKAVSLLGFDLSAQKVRIVYGACKMILEQRTTVSESQRQSKNLVSSLFHICERKRSGLYFRSGSLFTEYQQPRARTDWEHISLLENGQYFPVNFINYHWGRIAFCVLCLFVATDSLAYNSFRSSNQKALWMMAGAGGGEVEVSPHKNIERLSDRKADRRNALSSKKIYYYSNEKWTFISSKVKLAAGKNIKTPAC